MALVSDRCICLRKTEFSETSQILTLFSREHGLLRVIAKGAHRRTKAGASRFDGGIDFLDVGEAVFIFDPAREMTALTEWKLREGHLSLRKSLRGIYLAFYAAELVARLIEEHDPHPDLFDRLEQTLPELGGARREETFLAFELDVLGQSGYLAELFRCVACGKPASDRAPVFFSPSRGGVICGECHGSIHDAHPLDPRLLRLLQGVLRLPRANGQPQRLPQLTRHQTDPINRLLVGHIQHALSRPLRMAKYVAP